MRAGRAGHGDEGLAGLVVARLGILDRPSGRKIVTRRPVDPVDIGLGVDQLARRAVDGEEETVLRRVVQHLDRRSEEHTSELQSLMRISYAVFCLKKKT